MAKFSYKCETCGETFSARLERRYATYPCPLYSRTTEPSVIGPSDDKPPEEPAYKACGGIGKPVYAVAPTKIMEKLDNGLMARAVERVHNIEEITAADADAHSGPAEEEDDA